MSTTQFRQFGRTSTCHQLTCLLLMVIGSVLLFAISCSSVFAAPTSKKIIGYGWDTCSMTPVSVKQHIKELNASPFDGIAFSFDVKSNREDMTANVWTAFNHWTWDKSWFGPTIADLKAISRKSPKTKNSFLTVVLAAYDRGKWGDDKFWAAAANNMGIVASMAKQAGMKGIMLDTEAYNWPPWYAYDPCLGQGDYESQCKLARKRGAQIMAAMTKEYPNITVLSFMLLSAYTAYIPDEADPVELEKAKCWVMPAFFNGMLDGMSPGATLVDGVETAYTYQGDKFDKKYKVMREKVLPLVAPENRAKYASQFQVGFGQYIDCYTNPEGTPYYYFGALPGGTRTSRFMATLDHALSVSDEYVWVYGEKGCWWNFKAQSPKETRFETMPLWEKLLPGVTEGIRNINRHISDK